jgi:hypothetical protein
MTSAKNYKYEIEEFVKTLNDQKKTHMLNELLIIVMRPEVCIKVVNYDGDNSELQHEIGDKLGQIEMAIDYETNEREGE